MLDIVMIYNIFMHMFAKRLAQYSSELSGQHYVSVVLKYCLPADALYTLGHVVDRGCDTTVESFVVHSPNIGASRVRLQRKNKLCSLSSLVIYLICRYKDDLSHDY